jgi:hypothetical protein
LEPPKFTKGQFPPKIPRPAGQTRLKKYLGTEKLFCEFSILFIRETRVY